MYSEKPVWNERLKTQSCELNDDVLSDWRQSKMGKVSVLLKEANIILIKCKL